MSYYYESHMQRHHFLGRCPLGPGGGAKRSNIIKSELLSQFQRFFKPNFVYLLTNKRYITYQTGFSFGRLGHFKGWDLGVPWGVGGSKFFFPKFNQIWSVSYLHELHIARHKFLGPQPMGPRGGVKNFNFLNTVMWHIKLKGMSSRPGYTEKFYPMIKLVTLGWGQSVNYP